MPGIFVQDFIVNMFEKTKIFISSKGFYKYFKNTSYLLLEKILRLSLGLFVGIWVAKYLKPDQFGILNYSLSFVGLFNAVALLGLNSVVVKELVNNRNPVNLLLGTSFLMRLVCSFLMCILVFLIVYFTSTAPNESILIYIISFGMIFQSFNVIDFFNQSRVKSIYTVYSSIFSLLISSGLKVLCIMYKMDLIYFAYIVIIDYLIFSLFLIYFYSKKDLSIFKWRFNLTISKSLLNQSWPLILSSVTFIIYNNVDKIMIKNMMDNDAVGIYSAAGRLVMIWQFLPGLIVTSFLPSLVHVFHNKALFNKRMKFLSSFLIWSSIIICTLYSFFSETIISLTFGEDYNLSSTILSTLVWSNIFIFFNSVWNKWMLLLNKTRLTLYFSITSAFLNLVLNYFFIPLYGVNGASYALLLALSITYFIFYVIYDRRVIKLFIESLIFKF